MTSLAASSPEAAQSVDDGGFPRARKSSNASLRSEESPAALRKQRQTMNSFGGSSSNLSLPLLFIKEHLQWTVFSAQYKERRYVDFLNGYRDVLVVNSVEDQAIKVFKEVIKHCIKEMDEDVWIGIKKTSEGVQLYVELAEGVAFGNYWFLVRSVKYKSAAGLDLKIRCLRPVCVSDGPDGADAGGATFSQSLAGRSPLDWSVEEVRLTAVQYFHSLPWRDAADLFRQVFSVTSMRELFRLIGVILLLGLSCLRNAHVWLLRFMDTAGILVQRCTPLCRSLLDFVLKIVGGFYILLARIWFDMRRGGGTSSAGGSPPTGGQAARPYGPTLPLMLPSPSAFSQPRFDQPPSPPRYSGGGPTYQR